MPGFLRETAAMAKADRLWGFAFFCTILLPWMLIFSRVGMEICGAVIGLGFLWQSYRKREWGWLRSPLVIVCLLAWAWLSLVVTPFALKPGSGLAAAVLWFRLPLLFVALRYWVLARREALYTFAGTTCLMLVMVMADTFWQFRTGVSLSGMATPESHRLTGPFTNPKVGIFIAKFLLPVAVILFVGNGSRRLPYAAGLLMLAGLATIILAGERAAFLSTVLGTGVAMLLLMAGDKRLRLPCLVLALTAAALAGGLYATTPTVQVRAQQMVEVIRHFPQSSYGLLAYAGIDMGLEHPWHGVGLRGFRDLCPVFTVGEDTLRGMHPHNFYIEWFAEAGVMGLLLFVAMLMALIREAWKIFQQLPAADRLLPAVALGVLAQHFFPLMGMQSYFTNWTAFLVWFPLGVIFAALPRANRVG